MTGLMWSTPTLTTAAATDIVSAAEAKTHCRVDHTDDDTYFASLIDAATAYMDGWTGVLGRCLIDQTWTVNASGWQTRTMRLPFPDVQSITITYEDADNATQTLSSSLYELNEDNAGSYIYFLDSFTSPAVYDDAQFPVHFAMVCGYGSAATDVPMAIRQAALLLIGHMYENRESVSIEALKEVPMAFSALIAPYRRYRA